MEDVTRSSPLSARDRERVLVGFNQTADATRAEATIDTLFREIARERPDAPAVIAGDRAVTYRELDAASERLALGLVQLGVRPDEPVALLAARTPETIVALLAILKAGGAYLPLDAGFPRARIAFMLREAGVRVVLAGRELAPLISLEGRVLVELGGSPPQAAAGTALPDGDGERLAYVMYTSGSTGQPKGVLVRHRAVNRVVRNGGFTRLDESRTLLHAAPLAFDASTLEIWGALLNGGRLVLHPEVVPSARGLADCIRRHGVTTAWLTAALFDSVVDEDPAALRGLDELLVGGEALSVAHVRRAQAALPGTRLVNGYGPTECTTFTCCHAIPRPLAEDVRTIPIGRPIRDTTCYVLDEERQPVALGAAGELYVGGEGLARGYLGQPALTAERFVPDPFAPGGGRLYRTGDLVRWREDGVLEYLGRADAQVKIRGFRIEPGEVEVALAAHPAVQRAAVVPREDVPGVKRLVAYLVARTGAAPAGHGALREHLATTLPDAMIPSAFVWLPTLPLTPNGKLDRRALPAPSTSRPDLSRPYVSPAGEDEVRLAALWSELLGVEPIGRDDGFFELGGASLLGMRMLARARAELGLSVPAVALFENPTLGAFAAVARALAAAPAQRPAAPARAPGAAPAPGAGASPEAVAIVAVAGRFPGAPDVDRLWENLCAARDTTRFFAAEELDPAVPRGDREDPAYVRARGVLDEVELFDAGFFGMGAREAELTDPQNRLLLEVAWEALERAGHAPGTFRGPIGAFLGKYNNTYFERNVSTRPDLVASFGAFNVMAANEKDYVATRTAFKLDLTGPALSIHTACSTSLVAIAVAVESLRRGGCDLAIAGGASVTVPVRSGHLYQEGSMLSSDGRCRPFDAEATGTTFGDGVAVVVLRRLADALADGDQVLAVIRGVAINNDGARKASFTAPSVAGQVAVVSSALADAGVNPRSIQYVEAHGTATPLGDPIEVEALTRVFRAATGDQRFCALGSVKSNFGHLTIAAGAAGLIKTALALHHRLLPATLHFRRPNPALHLETSPFFVQDRLAPWPENAGAPRRAGVSGLGVGGTNAHVVLEEAPPAALPAPRRLRELLPISARTPAALDAATARLGAHLEAHPELELADVAHTLQVGRARFPCRRYVVAATTAEAAGALLRPAAPFPARTVEARPPAVVFAFPGQGSQASGMAAALREEPVFREVIDRCADAIRPLLERDLREVMWPATPPPEDTDPLRATCYAQPGIFAVGYGLACLWRSRGIEPVAMLGHSVGEFVCAVVAGMLPVEEAARLVALRGKLMQELPPGAMLSVSASAEAIAPRLVDRRLGIAAENAPNLCVVSGPADAVESLRTVLEAEGLACRPLRTSHAFHSPMMDPAVAPFLAAVRAVPLSPPRVPFASTVTGGWITDAEATDPEYWAGHLRQPVRFSSALRTALAEPERLLLELGPRATVAALARRQLPHPRRQLAISSLEDGRDDAAAIMAATGQLFTAGVEIDWGALRASGRPRRVPLPTYPFERKRHWIEPAARAAAEPPAAPRPELPVLRPNEALAEAARAVEPTAEVTVTATRREELVASLKDLFEEVSGLEIDPGASSASFVDLGLDSLFLTQASIQVAKKFAVKVTFRQLMESYPSLEALAQHLDAVLPPAAPAAALAPVPANGAVAPLAALAVPAAPAPAPLPVAAAGVQALIQEQLRIMSQQLLVLGAAAGASAPAIPAPAPSRPEAAPARGDASPAVAQGAGPDDEPVAPEKYDAKRAFGAIARIHAADDGMTPLQRARFDAFVRRYTARTAGSKRLTQEHRAHLADPRVVTGFKPALKEIVYQIVVDRSRGARLWDVDGNEYVDCLNGFGASYFGWQPPFVTEAVKRQLERGHEIGPMTPLAGEVARLFCELTGADRAAFCNTGSEAVMGCLRIARTVTGRALVASFAGSYHGIFDEVIVRGTKKLRAVPAAPGIMPSSSENMLVLDYGTPEALEILRRRAGELAAVLIEPVQSRRPDFQPREFLHAVRELTEQAGAACIFDEVITGFRIEPGGAQAHFGIRADLASYGKVVGGGFPVGVIAGKRAWMDALDGGPWGFGDDSTPTVGVTYFAGTFCRHPLALAAVKAVLDHVKAQGPALQQAMNARTAGLAAELNAHFRAAGVPMEVRHFSALWKVVFTQDVPHSELLFPVLRDRGLHIMEGFPCFLTTAHGADEVAQIVAAFKGAVAELQEAGFLPAPPAPKPVDVSAPPVPGARLGRDPEGNPAWYAPSPTEPGKYVKVSVS